MSPKDQVKNNFSDILLPRLFDFLSFKVVRMNDNGEDATAGCCSGLLMTFSIILIVLTFPVSIFFCIRIIPEYERAIIFRLGRLKKVKSQILSNFKFLSLLCCYQGGAVGPGLFFIIPCIDEIKVIDLRTITFDVPPQEILTKDSVTVKGEFPQFRKIKFKSCFLLVDAVVYYNIRNPMDAVCKIENFASATRLLSATTLRYYQALIFNY